MEKTSPVSLSLYKVKNLKIYSFKPRALIQEGSLNLQEYRCFNHPWRGMQKKNHSVMMMVGGFQNVHVQELHFWQATIPLLKW